MSDVTLLILLGAVMLCTLGGVTLLAHIYAVSYTHLTLPTNSRV